MDDAMDIVVGLLLLAVIFIIYFFPYINAKSRKHSKTEGIALLNLFLGWTLLGWVGALIWSVSENNNKKN